LLAAFPFSHASEKTYETEKQLASLLLISIFFWFHSQGTKRRKLLPEYNQLNSISVYLYWCSHWRMYEKCRE